MKGWPLFGVLLISDSSIEGRPAMAKLIHDSRGMKLSQVRVLLGLVAILIAFSSMANDWPEAAGPNHNFTMTGQAPWLFSASRDQHIVWRVPLPNTGESTPIVVGDRIFVTCHAPITADAQAGSTILGMCFDRKTGKELWRRELPGFRETDMASGFSDNTAASPVSDGALVCFMNVGGSIHVYDLKGKLQWSYDWVPFGRHHARQHEPILHAGKVIVVKTVAENLPESATTKAGAKGRGTEKAVWTRLQTFDLATGKRGWLAESGTSIHSASRLGQLADGTPAILTGRGGGHAPPEKPYGISLLNARDGTSRWDLPIKGYAAHQNTTWNEKIACCFVGNSHLTVDIETGTPEKPIPLDANARIRRHTNGTYETIIGTPVPKMKKPTTYQTNCLIGNYHYFRSHNGHFIGRINLETNQVEYLQVPVQVVRRKGKPDEVRWHEALPNDVKNNDGFVVCQDKRAKLDGWGHVSGASPIVIGDHLYMPTMIGMVYVLKWNAPVLDEKALVSISDLGPAQHTWSLSSLAFANGRLYARTIKELICIGAE
jgi:outer membrane protein assembly factor BamB